MSTLLDLLESIDSGWLPPLFAAIGLLLATYFGYSAWRIGLGSSDRIGAANMRSQSSNSLLSSVQELYESWTGRRDYGDTELGGWIERLRPDMVLTGHVHEPPFKPTGSWADRIGPTWVFNPGRQIGPVPAHIVIDLEAGAATWRSMMGEEGLSLDAVAAPARSVF